jgi:hypothetical protein
LARTARMQVCSSFPASLRRLRHPKLRFVHGQIPCV